MGIKEKIMKFSDELLKNAMGFINKSNAFINLTTGDIKSEGIDKLINDLKYSIGKNLDVLSIPGVNFKELSENNFLSKKYAEDLIEKFDIMKSSITSLNVTDISFLTSYRKESIKYFDDTVEKLDQYIRLFDSFFPKSRFQRWFKGKLSYEKVLLIEKQMKSKLKEIIDLVKTFGPKKYQKESFIKELFPHLEEGVESVAKTEATKLFGSFVESLDEFFVNADTKILVEGKPIFDFEKDKVTGDISKLVDYIRHQHGSSLSNRIGKALDIVGLDSLRYIYTGNDGKLSRAASRTYTNWKCYKSYVKDLTKKFNDEISEGKFRMPDKFLGDWLLTIKDKCFDYTLKELHNVFKLGRKNNELKNNELNNKGEFVNVLDIDLDKLFGSKVDFKVKDDVKLRTDASISNKMIDKLKSSVEKAYKDIEKLEKQLGKANDKVTEKGETMSDKKKELDDINKPLSEIIAGKSKSKDISEPNKLENYKALYYRKGKKFLDLCSERKKMLEKYAKEASKQAEDFLSIAKNRFKLVKKSKNYKDKKKDVSKSYDTIPKRVSTFIKDFEVNKEKYKSFLAMTDNYFKKS